MKEIKIIKQAKAIESAFYKNRITDINLWLFGKVSLVGCWQQHTPERPYIYFWKIVDIEKEDLVEYVGVFEKETPFTESPFNRIVKPFELILWENDIYCYYKAFNGMELITPFGLINPHSLQRIFPPQYNLSETPVDLYEAFDNNLKPVSRYWRFCGKDKEIWIPLFPLASPELHELENITVRKIDGRNFSEFGVKCHYDKNFVKVNISLYNSSNLTKLITELLCEYSEDCTDLTSFCDLMDVDIQELLTKLNQIFGTAYQNDSNCKTPQMVLDKLKAELEKRIFIY